MIFWRRLVHSPNSGFWCPNKESPAAVRRVISSFIMKHQHLREGSEIPVLENGLLRVYSMRFCPYAERTLLILCAKDIRHELVNVHLKSKPDWFLKRNPFGKVPVLEQDGKILCESLATCDYLDDVYPSPPMYSADPWCKAVDKSLIEILNEKLVTPVTKSFYKMFDQSSIATALEEVRKGIKVIEDELKKRGTKFLGGNKPGMVDYMIWPWLERLPSVHELTGNKYCLLSQDSFPLTVSYIKELEDDKVVKAIQLPAEQHTEFFKSFLNGSPNYDLGLSTDKDSKL